MASELLFLQFQKKQLQDLLQNSYHEKSWIRIEQELEKLKAHKKAYEELNAKPDVLDWQKRKIRSQLDSINRDLEQTRQLLIHALLKTDKETIMEELEKIRLKEEKYIDILLTDAKQRINDSAHLAV